MDAERWQRVEDALARALELPAAEREAFLARECPEELRDEVSSLLAASDGARGFFTGLAERAGLGFPDDAGPDLVGRRVGAYRLEALLGRGGMGAVYRAERADGEFRRRVAIKLLAMGASRPENRHRFLAERQVLARLDHPGIARLLDGGVTEDGTPYFVMELVEGAPIDAYCDARGMGIDERLALFCEVCEAVSYAHRNLVVHRDLKPSNILVAEGRVRLLDFGIAKLLPEDPDRGRVQTAAGEGFLTPGYAAPEQLEGGVVTTATDVYSLGVVLYELLTGLSPYEEHAGSGLALARAVCERPVTSPSARLRRLAASGEGRDAAAVEALARARGLSAPALARRLRGDLDTILLEALHKDPARRYESVAALAEDVRRHGQDLPVRARRDGFAYRASRFFLRHSVGAAAAAAIALLAAGLFVLSLWLAESESRQEERLAETRRHADGLLAQLTDLYERVDPAATPGSADAARSLLDAAVESLEGAASLAPEDRATLLFAAGRVYRRMGAVQRARPLFEEALEIRRGAIAPPRGDPRDRERLAEVLFELGQCRHAAGEGAAGVELLEEALRMERELHGDDHLHVAQIRFQLGSAYHEAGGGDPEAEFREAVRIFGRREAAPEEQAREEHARALLTLGSTVAVRGEIPEARALYEEALGLATGRFGEAHPLVAEAIGGIGMLEYHLGREEEAAARLRRAVAIGREVYGAAGHPDLALHLLNLGNVEASEGRPRGVEHIEEAVRMQRELGAVSPVDRGFCLTSLGKARRRFGDREGARAAYEEALELYATQGVPAMFRAEARDGLARLLLEGGPSERAIELLEAVVEGWEATLPEDHPRVRAARERLATAVALRPDGRRSPLGR